MLNGISDTSSIKATGPRGHLTKGDVLAHLGKISSATGSEKPDAPVSHSGYGSSGKVDEPGKGEAVKEAPKKDMSALEFRQLIASGLGQAITPAAKPTVAALSESYSRNSASVREQVHALPGTDVVVRVAEQALTLFWTSTSLRRSVRRTRRVLSWPPRR